MSMALKLKEIVWVGSSRRDLKTFPDPVKLEIGYALFKAQKGDKHHSAKPFKGKGLKGVFEIVNDYQKDAYRALYAVKIDDKIYVLHSFQKKSKTGIKTPKQDVDTIVSRYKDAQILSKRKSK